MLFVFFVWWTWWSLCRSIHSGTLQAPSFLGEGRQPFALCPYEHIWMQKLPVIFESWFCTNLLIGAWLVSGNYGVHNPSKPWFLAKLWNHKALKKCKGLLTLGDLYTLNDQAKLQRYFIGAFHHRCQGHVGKSMIRLRREKNGENRRFPFRVPVNSRQVGDPNRVGHRTIEIRANDSGLKGEGL